MKKILFTANLIAMLVLIPAVMVGYMHSQTPATGKSTTSTETVKDVTNGQEDGISISLVKSF